MAIRRPRNFRRCTETGLKVVLVVVTGTPAAAATCESLTSVPLPDTTIESASVLLAGPFIPPGLRDPLELPSFCRVVGKTAPAVNFEVWLPIDGWNGKFHVSGNGGMAGIVSYEAMATALGRGYAAASTDTGHVRPGAGGFDASWAIGHPELVTDFGHRSLHVTADNGKAITAAFYNRAPRYSYYVGCSKGGQQGLMEAQRYPDDFDGIVAGNPANNWTRFYAGAHLWYSLATLRDAASYIPRSKLPLLASAVNTALRCARRSRGRRPRRPAGVHLRPGGSDVPPRPRRRYLPHAGAGSDGAHHLGWLTDLGRRGHLSGLVPGGENGPGGGWGTWVTGAEPFASLHWRAAEGFFKYMVFEDPDWNFGRSTSTMISISPSTRWVASSTAPIPTSTASATAGRS